MRAKIPYYVVKKGRGYFQPNSSLKAKGFKSVPCGADGVRARELATRLAKQAVESKHLRMPWEPLRAILAKSFKNAKERSKKRGTQFEITLEDVYDLVSQQEWRCCVSGQPFRLVQVEGGIVRQPYAPSIDRIDSSLGYIHGNVRVVLTAVNYALNEWGDEVFSTVARGVIAAKRRTKVGTSSNCSPRHDRETINK